MRNIRFRWLLPYAHTTIDLVVLGIWLWHSHADLYNQKRSPRHPALFVQVRIDVYPIPDFAPPTGFLLLTSGTLPAVFVSDLIRSEAAFRRSKWWDPAWFVTYEAAAMLIWFALGMVTDAAGPGFRRVMSTYLASRATFAVFAAIAPASGLGTSMQLLFWIGLALYGIGYLVIQGVARIPGIRTRH